MRNNNINRKIIKGGNKISKKSLAETSDIPTLKYFLLYITSSDNTSKCPQQDSCKIPDSKSGQKIAICEDSVFKGPPPKWKMMFKTVENHIDYSIRIDPYTMNLLIQTVINKLIEKSLFESREVEHYRSLCLEDGTYELESVKAGWGDDCKSTGDKCYATLEDYLIKNNDIDVNQVMTWLEQVFNTLDKLYDTIQFHHCDPKAAQILLTTDGYATVGDLDKVTFSMNINLRPYHIRLIRRKNPVISSAMVLWEELGKVTTADEMRYESKPRNNCVFEKFCFLSSVCLLSGSVDTASVLAVKGIELINKQCTERNEDCTQYYLNIPNTFDFSENNRKKQRSLSVPVNYVHTGKAEYVDIKSIASLSILEKKPVLTIN